MRSASIKDVGLAKFNFRPEGQSWWCGRRRAAEEIACADDEPLPIKPVAPWD